MAGISRRIYIKRELLHTVIIDFDGYVAIIKKQIRINQGEKERESKGLIS